MSDESAKQNSIIDWTILKRFVKMRNYVLFKMMVKNIILKRPVGPPELAPNDPQSILNVSRLSAEAAHVLYEAWDAIQTSKLCTLRSCVKFLIDVKKSIGLVMELKMVYLRKVRKNLRTSY